MEDVTKKTSGLENAVGPFRRLTIGIFLIILTQFNIGCATMIRGMTSTVSIKSEPSGATIYIDGIRQIVPTPATVTLSRTRHDIGLEKDGHIGQQQVINTRVYWPAMPLLAVDVIPLGLGVVLDLWGDGFLKMEPEEVHCSLAEASATNLAKERQRICGYRPPVPTGMGTIYVDHPRMLPGGAKLFVSIESQEGTPAAHAPDQREVVVTMDAPARFNLKPGRHVVLFRKLGSDAILRKDILVEMDNVSYLRATSTAVDGYLRVLWSLSVTNMPEREVLMDLYYSDSDSKRQ